MDNPNIVLIVLDTVRAQNLSCYGYERETTPYFETIADESIRFHRAFAPAPWTVPSHASLFTGTYVAEHQTKRSLRTLNRDLPTLSEQLSDAGYTTIGLSNNLFISPDFGFDRGFDHFETLMDAYQEPFSGGTPVSQIRRATSDFDVPRKFVEAVKQIRENDDRLVPTVANWLYRKGGEAGWIQNYDRGARTTNERLESIIADADEPFFLFVNYMEGHAPYRAPNDYRHAYVSDPDTNDWGRKEPYFENRADQQDATVRDLKDQYDGCIRYLDDRIQEFNEFLEDLGMLDDTLLMITGDHGEAFGEHGLYEHESGVYNELARIPLLVTGGACPDSDDVHQPVSLRWVPQTLLELVNAEVPPQMERGNLFRPDDPVVIESEPLPFTLDESEDCSVSTGRYANAIFGLVSKNHKYIRFTGDGSEELYELDDGSEENELSADKPHLTQELSEELDALLDGIDSTRRAQESVVVSEDVQEHLADLGYRTE